MTITIPQRLTHGKELVVIPLEEYEELAELRKIYEFKPSNEIKKALAKARKNRKKGQVLTLHELKNKPNLLLRLNQPLNHHQLLSTSRESL